MLPAVSDVNLLVTHSQQGYDFLNWDSFILSKLVSDEPVLKPYCKKTLICLKLLKTVKWYQKYYKP